MEIERVIKSKKYKKGRDRCGYEPIYILKDIPKLTAEKKPDRVYLDMRGYFLIKVEKGWIYAGQVNKKNEMFRIMKGKTAEDLYSK